MQRPSRLSLYPGLIMLLFVAGCGSDSPTHLVDPEAVRAEVDEMIWARETRKRLLTQDANSTGGVSVLVEVVEAPLSQIRHFLSQNPNVGSDADLFRREVQVWLKTSQAKLNDFAVIHGSFGSRSELKSVTETPRVLISGDAPLSESEDRWNGRIIAVLPTARGRNEIQLELSTEMRNSISNDSPISKSIHTTVRNGSYALLEIPPQLNSTEVSESGEVVRLTFVRADSF